MELTNDFVIERGIEETWAILNDLEFIAPCMPGAQLTEIEGDEYRGLVKIKVGPITANYKGKASFIEQDAANHVAKLKAEGRDPRQGNANAVVTATLEEVAADQTRVEIHTDLGLSGKIASFGRGAIEDVSKKLLGQFSDNLRDKLASESPSGGSATGQAVSAGADGAAAAADNAAATVGDAASSAADSVSGAASSAADSVSGAASSAADSVGDAAAAAAEKVGDAASSAADSASDAASSAADSVSGAASSAADSVSGAASSAAGTVEAATDKVSGGVRKINSPEPEAVDLLAVGGESMAKRLVPAVGLLAVVVAFIWWLISRG